MSTATHKRHKTGRPPAPGTPPRQAEPAHDWAARAAALQYEPPVLWTVLAAIGAMMVTLAGWVAVLIPQGGNIRFAPVFWLLALPLCLWIGGLASTARWAIATTGLALLASPALSLLALVTAQASDAPGLATPLAMQIILGLSSALAAAGLVALRRSSLPGGTRPARYILPGTRPAGLPAPLPAEIARAIGTGSITLSATLINGVLGALAITILHAGTPEDPSGPAWIAILPAAMVLILATLTVRGAAGLRQGRFGAPGTIRLAWRLGMPCPAALLVLVWAWPGLLVMKAVASLIMLPLAIAAIWGGLRALRSLSAVTMAARP